jgi:hypothetical protein
MTPDTTSSAAGILKAAETRFGTQTRSVGQLSRPEDRHQVTVNRGPDGIELIHVTCPCGRHVDLKLVADQNK